MKLDILSQDEFIIFTTREFANYSAVSLSAASKQLSRLKNRNAVVQLTRGVWANQLHPYFSPQACVPKLLGNEQGYVSFLTVLHQEGVLSQIPTSIQIATTGHSRKLNTSIGVFEFFKVKPELCQQGIVWSETRIPYLVATIEKALFDTFYIATRKKKRFAKLPELDLKTSEFKQKNFLELLASVDLPLRIRSAIRSRYEKLVQ